MSQLAVAIVGPGWSGTTRRLAAVVEGQEADATWLVASLLEADVPYGALRPLTGAEPTDHHAAAEALAQAVGSGVLVVDSAHDLDEQSIRSIAALVDRGGSVVVAHRPALSASLTALDELIERRGELVRMGPLDEPALAAALAEAGHAAIDSELAAEIHRLSGGMVGIGVALLGADGALLEEPAELTDRVDRELSRAGASTRAVAELLAMAVRPPDDVVCSVAEVDDRELVEIADQLARAGLTGVEDTLDLLPAIRSAVRSSMAATDRRAVHRRLAAALIDRGGEAIEAAEHLLASGATGPEAAAVMARAGDDLRYRRPDDALDWYDEAVAAGAPPSLVAPGRAEAAAFAGRPVDLDAQDIADSDDVRARVLAVRAAESSREGRLRRSVDLYHQVEDHPVLSPAATAALGATSLVAMGRLDEAREALAVTADPLDARADLARYLSEALVAHSTAPGTSAPLFVEAAEALERIDLDVVLPDSSHALGALCLSLAGDLPAAESLLQRAILAAPAGPAFDVRHRLLLAWVHLRTARYELPTAERSAIDVGPLDARDRLLHAAIGAGLARRSGDVPALRAAWSEAEPVLMRGVGDLFHVELLSELVLAAARLRQRDRTRPVMEALTDAVDHVGDARAWTIPAAWLDVQLAVEEEAVEAVEAAHERISGMGAETDTHSALQQAAASWCEVLGARIEPDGVIEVARGLAAVDLPWEASRLAGQAAVRVSDPSAARRLLEHARAFHHDPESPTGPVATDAGLTSREVDVGRYVLDGLTYREIGAQLYISPKTVEHHVARIRRKVRANTRAEMLAALRALFFDQGAGETGSA